MGEGRQKIVSLYHVTDSSRLPSIMQIGLDPSKSREVAYRQRLIYLSADPGHAGAYADHHGDWTGRPVMLRINVADLDHNLLGPDDVDLPDILDDRDWRDVTWQQSLRLSGQCTYAGIIPPSVIHVEAGRTVQEARRTVCAVRLSEAGDPYLYHGTSRSLLPKIARDGLQPQAGDPDEYEDEEPFPRVWATRSADEALQYAKFYPDPVMLRFPKEIGEPWETASWPPGIGDQRFTRKPIPSSAIEIYQDQHWLPLARTVQEAQETGGAAPMDHTARMRRAEVMGFDTSRPLYHGTGGVFDRFDKSYHGKVMGANKREPFAIWLTSSPEAAGEYAMMATTDRELWDGTIKKGEGDPNIMPVFVNWNHFMVQQCHDFNHYALLRRKGSILRLAKQMRAPGVIFKNAEDGTHHRSDVYAVFDPRRVRSVFADFVNQSKLAGLSETVGAALREAHAMLPRWWQEGTILSGDDLDRLDASEFIEGDEFDYEWRLCRVPVRLLPTLTDTDIAEMEQRESGQMDGVRHWLRTEGGETLRNTPLVALLTSTGIALLDGWHRATAASELGWKEMYAAVGLGERTD